MPALPLFRRILVPTDFGEAAQHAADVAASMAGASEGSVTLLHIWSIPPVYTDGFAWPVDGLEEAAQRALDREVKRVQKGLPRVESALAMGVPWEAILAIVEQRKIDLVVMGTHGRTGLPRFWLGSVAERLVRMSPVPVLTMHAPPVTS